MGHNRRALSALLLGLKSPIFDVEHLQLFSRKSMRRLLTTAGFTRIRVVPILNCYPLSYWLRLLPIPRRLKQQVLPALLGTRLGQLALPLPAGNLAALGFKS